MTKIEFLERKIFLKRQALRLLAEEMWVIAGSIKELLKTLKACRQPEK